MRIAFSRAALFITGSALLLAALLTALADPVGAAPGMLVTETPSSEPATRTATATATVTATATATASTLIPTATSTAVPPTATSTAGSDGGGSGSGEKNTPEPTSTLTPTMTPIPQFADPAITKSASVSAAQVGDTVEFTLSATNLGNVAARDVVIEDSLPAFLALAGVSATRGDVSISGSTIRVVIGDLAPGEVVTVTVTTRVVASAAPPNNSNIATISASSPNDDPSNNSSSVALTVDAIATPAPPASLPNTSDPEGGAALPILLAVGLGLIAASLLTRRRI